MTAALAAACAAGLPIGRAFAAGKRKPNFVVVLCDDLGYGDVGIYGQSNIPPPAIDRIRSPLSAMSICDSGSVERR